MTVDPELRTALAKQSAVETQLAIKMLLKQKEIAVWMFVTCLTFAFISGWSGKWDECCFHLRSCLRLAREVSSLGQESIDSDLITCIENMVAIAESIPPTTGTTQVNRLAYSHSVVLAAKHWMDALIARLERRHALETLRLSLRYHRSRINWILSKWRDLFPAATNHAEVEIESSPYATAQQNIENLWSSCETFSYSLLSMQLSLGLRSTLL